MCAARNLIVLLFPLLIIHGNCRKRGMDDDLIKIDEDPIAVPSEPNNVLSASLQSPINLETAEALEIELSGLIFRGHWNLNHRSLIENTGHTVEIGETSLKDRHPTLQGGPLNGVYVFSQAHFHWGNHSFVGSEHTINGHRYSMEVHFVHHHIKYKSIKEARGHNDGIAVVAFFLKVLPRSSRHNTKFNLVVHHLTKLRKRMAEEPAEPNILSCLRQLAAPGGYFFYYGSLTTEPFSENVQWIVYPTWASITETQVSKFRDLLDEGNKPITSNYRKLQDLNDRVVYLVKAAGDEYDYDYDI